MFLNKLDSKKQIYILAMLVLVVMGLYVQFRFVPVVNDVRVLKKQLVADRLLLKNPKIPEEPFEDVDELEDKVVELDVDLEQLIAQSASLSKKLPELDGQDVMLKISEAARASMVRIVNNVPFLVKKRIELQVDARTGKKRSAAAQKKYEKRLRKAMKRARQKATSGGVGVLTAEGELMDKLVNDFDVARPLHQLKIEGSYNNVKKFIEALQGLPWQITVVEVNFKLLGANAAQGYPQPLIVDMIIGA